MLEYRCTPIFNVNSAPCELLNSRLLRTKLPITKQNLEPKVQVGIATKMKDSQIN